MVDSNKQQYYMVDVLKLLFSFCIVAIHTNLFLREYPTIYWYSSHVVWRIAVPFFFIASGYFFCKKVKTSNEPNKVLKKTIRRLLTLLVFWLLVSLPLEVRTLIIQGIGSKQLVFELLKKVIFYPWGALWYILALIVSYVLIYPFLRKNDYKIPIIIGSFLFIFGIFANSYYFLIEGTFFQKIIDWYLKNFISSRNGLFLGFFYIAIANYMTVKGEFSRKTNILLLIIGILGLLFEAYFIRRHHYIEDHSMFFSLLLVTPALFELAKSYYIPRSGKLFRNLSIGVYVLHRPILGYLNYFFQLEEKVTSMELFVIILSVALIMSYLLQKLNNKFINKVIT